MKESLPLKLN